MLRRIEEGTGTDEDVRTLKSASDYMLGMTICVLADALAMPVQSYLQKFADEFQEHLDAGKCPYPEYDLAPTGDQFWEDGK